MSNVAVVPQDGALEPIFGLRIYSELPFVTSRDGRGIVTVVTDQDIPTNDILIAEDPSQATGYRILTNGGNDSVLFVQGVPGRQGKANIRTGEGNDSVITGANDDSIWGDDGNDRLFGSDGEDILYGGEDDDWLRGGEGADLLFGGSDRDRLAGGNGDDFLIGGEGPDILIGGRGDDVLVADQGRDRLIGGVGHDQFRLRSHATDGLDKVLDFNPDEDVIEISRSLLPGSGLSNGHLSRSDFQVVHKISKSVEAKIEAKIVYESSTGLIYYNPGHQGTTPIPLFQVNKNLPIAADAFQIIS